MRVSVGDVPSAESGAPMIIVGLGAAAAERGGRMARIDLQASLHYGTGEPELAMVVVTQDENGQGVSGLPESAFQVLMLANDTHSALSGHMDIAGVDEAPKGTYRLVVLFDF